MLKNSSFLNGLGIGLVAGALLLQLMNAVVDPGHELPSAALGAGGVKGIAGETGAAASGKDADQWKKQAEQNGVRLYTQAELDALVQAKPAEQPDRLSPQKAQSRTDAAAAESPSPPEPANSAAAGNKIAVYLSGGLNAEEIAYALHRSGAIADAGEFQRELVEQELTGKIRAGYYEFDGPQDVAHVISLLTASPQ